MGIFTYFTPLRKFFWGCEEKSWGVTALAQPRVLDADKA